MRTRDTVCLLLGLLACGCAPDLSDSLDPGTEGPAGAPPTVDASDSERWVAFDLDAAEVVEETDPRWDLMFRRFEILVNGGISGDGTVEVAVLDGADYDALTEAPADGYLVDEDDLDGDGVDDRVFIDWYDYDYETHLLSPADRIYVVHTTEDAYIKLVFRSYYDKAGSAGMISFEQASVAPPGGGR